MDWLEQLANIWQWLVAALTLTLALLASGHALLHKRDSRAAMAWVGFIWFVPLGGAVLYFLLGVNRIKRRAVLLRGELERFRARPAVAECSLAQLAAHLPAECRHLTTLASTAATVLDRPLLPGNTVVPLINGDEAYPAMLEAIGHARQSISLSTYILDRKSVV